MIVGIVALLVAGLALVGLGGSKVETHTDGPAIAPPDSGEPVVAALRESGGWAPLGLHVVDSTHSVEVWFVDQPGCSGKIHSGDRWPTGHPECSGHAGIAGTVRGLGVTPQGGSIVGVEFTVSGACYARLKLGDVWPPKFPQCTTG